MLPPSYPCTPPYIFVAINHPDMCVKAWTEKIAIPTYGVGAPERNPIFLEKRVYQGSSGVVYPYPIIEKILDEKKDVFYEAVFLENQYLKIMILPELGGRIQMAYDKVQERHFIYYNQVIKPALVGLAGPWISGGIEFNWPQHHRPSTFERIDYTIAENADGSKTVWVNEVERMFHTKGMAGFTLYPGRAYLEINGKLYNRTPFPQTFLWWANPAVKVNDHYQSVFPPDVHAVFDHGKRDVSSFPIATGEYYKVNYAPGTDISWYKNIPVPTSYMAIRSEYDFIGGYEHDTQAGVLHVADHHVSTGKKQWTWGNSDFGQAWDRNLTDEDGPYIEIMTGVFTDNQPDFSWIQPNEEKTFTQYFMPYSKVGLVKNATREAMVNLEEKDGSLHIVAYATALYENAKVLLYAKDKKLFEKETNISPEKIFEAMLPAAGIAHETLRLEIRTAGGRLLVSYQPECGQEKEIPPPAKAAPDPKDIGSNELLYLNGLHLEQYRHATCSPVDYYEEALRRDAGDVRNNNALGLWYLRRGQFARSIPYFQAAIERLTLRNPNPYDEEPYYNLGWALLLQGKKKEAYDTFYKATWNGAQQSSAFFALARIAAAGGDHQQALHFAEKSLLGNYHGHSVRHLKAVLLRKLGREKEAHAFIKESLAIDPFNYGCLFEEYIWESEKDQAAAEQTYAQMQKLMGDRVSNYIAYATDYMHAGCYEEAIRLLKVYVGEPYPMTDYYISWCYRQLNDHQQALAYARQAASLPADHCFPNRLEDIPVLQSAMELDPQDAKAGYYLGNLWYDKRQYAEAIHCWERSAREDDTFPTVFRNLALAYHNQLRDAQKALAAMEKAFALDNSDGRVLMELDQLYRKMNKPVKDRLQLLEKHLPLVKDRDDLYLERVTLYNQSGEHQKARELIAARQFHPWEGGEGKVVKQYLLCHMELVKQALQAGDHQQALRLLQACEKYPHNLGEGKLYGTPENDIHYLQGCAYEGAGEIKMAKEKFEQATQGASEPVQAIFYNDPQPDKIFYQGLAWQKLGDLDKARTIFRRLIDFGNQHIDDHVRIDYFAVSLPDLLVFDQDLDEKNRIHCLYLLALGNLGLGHAQEAAGYFDEVLRRDVHHQGAMVHRRMNAIGRK